MNIKYNISNILISLLFGLITLTGCTSNYSTSIVNTWYPVIDYDLESRTSYNLITFYDDGTCINEGRPDYVINYNIQKDGTLSCKNDTDPDYPVLYFDFYKTDSPSEALENRKTYYLKDGVLILERGIYFIEGNSIAKKNAEEIYNTYKN